MKRIGIIKGIFLVVNVLTIFVLILWGTEFIWAISYNRKGGVSVHNSTRLEKQELVTVKWMIMGYGKQLDSERVWSIFNEQLQDKLPNTSVTFEVIPEAMYWDIWRLRMASKEGIDIVLTGYTIPYEQEVLRGLYTPMDSLMGTYSPALKKELPEWVWDLTRVNGFIYSVPNIHVEPQDYHVILWPFILKCSDGGYIVSNIYEMSEEEFHGYNLGNLGSSIPLINLPALAIPITASYPGKAMRLIELMNVFEGKHLYNLLVYGIEGEHYTRISKNDIHLSTDPEKIDRYSRYGLPKWTVGNVVNAFQTQYKQKNPVRYQVESPLSEIKLSIDPIKDEYNNLLAIIREYELMLILEGGSDYKEITRQMLERMQMTDAEVLREHLQSQVDGFFEKISNE